MVCLRGAVDRTQSLRAPAFSVSSYLALWITSLFTLSLTINVLATILLSCRIIRSNYKVKRHHAGARWSVLETRVQSAALYSAALISLLTTYVAGPIARYVCLDALQPIIVSTPCTNIIVYAGAMMTDALRRASRSLIIISVGLGETLSENSNLEVHRLPVDPAGAPPLALLQSDGHGQPYPLHSLAVNVLVSRTYDRASFDVYEQNDPTGSGVHVMDVESGQGGPQVLSLLRQVVLSEGL